MQTPSATDTVSTSAPSYFDPSVLLARITSAHLTPPGEVMTDGIRSTASSPDEREDAMQSSLDRSGWWRGFDDVRSEPPMSPVDHLLDFALMPVGGMSSSSTRYPPLVEPPHTEASALTQPFPLLLDVIHFTESHPFLRIPRPSAPTLPSHREFFGQVPLPTHYHHPVPHPPAFALSNIKEEESNSQTVEHVAYEAATAPYHACEWLECTRAFGSVKALDDHVQEEHVSRDSLRGYTCLWRSCRPRVSGAYRTDATMLMSVLASHGVTTHHGDTHVSSAPPRPRTVPMVTFPKRSKLLLHLRQHTGLKPYACPECPKRFTRVDMLASHQRSHARERQKHAFPCDYCERSYMHRKSLLKHLREVHSVE